MISSVHFEGTCAVCGQSFSYDHDFTKGLIDHLYDDDGRMGTWVRHYATAPTTADPNCAVYSTLIWSEPLPI